MIRPVRRGQQNGIDAVLEERSIAGFTFAQRRFDFLHRKVAAREGVD